MKKIIYIVLLIAVILTLCSCQKNPESETSNDVNTSSVGSVVEDNKNEPENSIKENSDNSETTNKPSKEDTTNGNSSVNSTTTNTSSNLTSSESTSKNETTSKPPVVSEPDTPKEDKNLPKWCNDKLTFNGVELKIPCTYNELKNLIECTLHETDDYIVKPNETGEYYLYKNNCVIMYIICENKTNVDKKCSECTITTIEVFADMFYAPYDDKILFPCGLKLMDVVTKSDIEDKLGKPDKYYTNEFGGESFEYYCDRDYNSWYFIYISDGKITNIAMSCRTNQDT